MAGSSTGALSPTLGEALSDPTTLSIQAELFLVYVTLSYWVPTVLLMGITRFGTDAHVSGFLGPI